MTSRTTCPPVKSHLPVSDTGSDLGVTTCLTLLSRYLSNAASLVLCVFRRVKDHHTLPNHSPCLKKSCVRQVHPAAERCDMVLHQAFRARRVHRRWGATWCYTGCFVRDIYNMKCNTSPPQGVVLDKWLPPAREPNQAYRRQHGSRTRDLLPDPPC